MRRTRTRLLALTALLLVALAVVFIVRPDHNHTYSLVFDNAGQLVGGDQVQVGGVPIGSITDIELTDDNRARVTIAVRSPYAPLHEGTTAEIRASSLSGVANRYVALRPGPNNAPRLAEGATLGTTQTSGIVDLDQLFDTFDPRTRKALQEVVHGSATQFAGAARAFQRSASTFAPALSATDRVVQELQRDEPALTDFLVQTGRTTTVLASERVHLRGIVAHTAGALSATARQSAALTDAIGQLPRTLREGQAAFGALETALPDLRRLVDATKPVAPQLPGFLRDVGGFAGAAQPTLHDLRLALDRPKSADVVDATRALPGFEARLSPAARNGIAALQQLEPIAQFARPYAPDVAGALRTFGQASANYDANGHYARVAPTFNRFSFQPTATGPGVLAPADPSANPLGSLLPAGLKRCPGSAAAPPQDGSAPFVDDPPVDCDLDALIPGA
jgi:phospholipid/cholesterol/gamma-HCH transport system substrate-binding protein